MKKIAIVTDSTVGISQIDAKKYGIEVVPANLMYKGKIYRDGIDLDYQKAYEFLKDEEEPFSTSAPSAGDFLKAYRESALKSEKIICITLSSQLSATYDSARMAKELFLKENSAYQLEVIDSATVTASHTMLVFSAIKMSDEGKNFEEIVKAIEILRDKAKMFLVLETIRYLYRSGRIPQVASKIGAILPFKPLIKVSEGKLHPFGMVSSKAKGVDKIITILKENIAPDCQQIGITHSNVPKEAEMLRDKIKQIFPSKEVFIIECSPAISYVAGPGALGVGFYEK